MTALVMCTLDELMQVSLVIIKPNRHLILFKFGIIYSFQSLDSKILFKFEL